MYSTPHSQKDALYINMAQLSQVTTGFTIHILSFTVNLYSNYQELLYMNIYKHKNLI